MEVGSFKILFFRGEKFPIQNSREPIGLFINVSVIAFPEVNTLGYMIYFIKKMFNLDEHKEFSLWQGQNVENVVFLFLTSGFALVLPNSNN